MLISEADSDLRILANWKQRLILFYVEKFIVELRSKERRLLEI